MKEDGAFVAVDPAVGPTPADPVPPTAPDILIAAAVFAVALVAYLGLTIDFLVNPDAVVYSSRIETHFFSKTTIHLAYYYLGVVFTSVLPLAHDHALNVMNCILGAAGCAFVYLIATAVTGRRVVAVAAALVVGANYVFVQNSIFTECYVPETCFLLLALLLWLHGKAVWAALALAVAFLNLPVAVMSLPLFYLVRPRSRPLVVFAAVFTLTVAALIAPFAGDFFFGSRGVISGVGKARVYTQGAVKEVKELFLGFTVALPVIFVGLLRTAFDARVRRWGMGIVAGAVLVFLLAESTGDVPAQLGTYALYGIFFALGYQFLAEPADRARRVVAPAVAAALLFLAAVVVGSRGKETAVAPEIAAAYLVVTVMIVASTTRWRRSWIAHAAIAVTLCACAWSTYSLVWADRTRFIEQRDDMLAVSRIANPDYVYVSGWGESQLYDRYAFYALNSPRWIHARCLMIPDFDIARCDVARERWRVALESGSEVWLFHDGLGRVEAELEARGYRIERAGAYLRAQPPGAHTEVPSRAETFPL